MGRVFSARVGLGQTRQINLNPWAGPRVDYSKLCEGFFTLRVQMCVYFHQTQDRLEVRVKEITLTVALHLLWL